MTKEQIHLRYDGPDLDEHRIDVAILAPALMGFGELLKEANRVLNGDKSKVNVLVNADIEANCITLSMVIEQSVTAWEAVKGFITDDDYITAKELIGLVLTSSGVTGGWSFFKYLQFRKENSIQGLQIKKKEENSNITINIAGDNNTVTIPAALERLATDKKTVKAAQKVIEPVAKRNGINSASFYSSKEDKIEYSVDKKAAQIIIQLDDVEQELEPQYIEGHISIYKVELSQNAKRWSFTYNGNQEEIDISETSIAKDTMKRGKVIIGDTYKVGMEITERKTPSGYKNDFKVIRVLDFIPGKEQEEFDYNDDT